MTPDIFAEPARTSIQELRQSAYRERSARRKRSECVQKFPHIFRAGEEQRAGRRCRARRRKSECESSVRTDSTVLRERERERSTCRRLPSHYVLCELQLGQAVSISNFDTAYIFPYRMTAYERRV